MESQQLIVTTSWDDGHPLDLKLADLLDKYNIRGTFYIPLKNEEHKVMDFNTLHNIASCYEVGGHTVNHLYLNALDDSKARYEISACKTMLEELTGNTISAFCFPGGKYSTRDIELARNAGYLFSRTAAFFHDHINHNRPLLNTTVQAYPHSTFDLLKHCMKRGQLDPIQRNNLFIAYNHKFYPLAKRLVQQISRQKGIFHLWGHSWEIEQYGLWNELEETFKMLRYIDNALFLDNTECWKYNGIKQPKL